MYWILKYLRVVGTNIYSYRGRVSRHKNNVGDIYIHIHIHIHIDIDDYWYDLCTGFMEFYNHLYEYIFVPTTIINLINFVLFTVTGV